MKRRRRSPRAPSPPSSRRASTISPKAHQRAPPGRGSLTGNRATTIRMSARHISCTPRRSPCSCSSTRAGPIPLPQDAQDPLSARTFRVDVGRQRVEHERGIEGQCTSKERELDGASRRKCRACVRTAASCARHMWYLICGARERKGTSVVLRAA